MNWAIVPINHFSLYTSKHTKIPRKPRPRANNFPYWK